MLSLSLKFLVASAIGAGSLAGGWAIYNETLPITIEDKFNKNGFITLKEDGEYKAIFYDQKEKIKEVKEIGGSESNNYTKIKEWCENQKKTKLSENKENPNFAILCTSAGITSIRGYLTQQFPSTKWIDEEEKDKDKLYKIVFVVYKFKEEFLSWINKGRDTKDHITSESETDKFNVLKEKCSKDLPLSYQSMGDDIKYYRWWCQTLPYKTIEEKLKHSSSDWSLKSDWKNVSNLWNKTEAIRNAVKPNNSAEHPKDEEYKKWCEEKIKLGLEEDKIYPVTYVMVKSVCSK